jgi:hypothetical protein
MRKAPNLTDEQRAARREMIHRTKPWLRSTGPKTTEGKAKAAQRWRRHGMRSKEAEVIRQWLHSLIKLAKAINAMGEYANIASRELSKPQDLRSADTANSTKLR